MSLTYGYIFKSGKGSMMSAPQPASEKLCLWQQDRSAPVSLPVACSIHVNSCTLTRLLGQSRWSFALSTSAFVWWFLFPSSSSSLPSSVWCEECPSLPLDIPGRPSFSSDSSRGAKLTVGLSGSDCLWSDLGGHKQILKNKMPLFALAQEEGLCPHLSNNTDDLTSKNAT